MMKIHPLCEILPDMSETDYIRLRDDIKARGMQSPIIEYEGAILDGRHRWRACVELGIKPRIEPYKGDDPAAYVYSVNVAHRHLTKTQLVIAAAKLKGYYAEQAKKRQQEHGGTAPGRPSSTGGNISTSEGKARDQAGKAFGVSGKAVDDGERILKSGIPDLITKVERGEISVNQGRQIAKLGKERQKEIVQLPTKKAITAAIKKSVHISAGRRAPTDKVVPQNTAPGTALVKNLLLRLEGIADEIDRSGMTPEQYAQAFVEQFDWHEPLLVNRLRRAEIGVRCVASLSVMSQRAKRAA
jgi:hypothetical protein